MFGPLPRLGAATSAAVLPLCSAIASAQTAKPRIVIVATGGTIAGAAESTTAAGYKSGAVAVDVLIDAVPQMKKFADVRGVQVSSVGSQDMNDEIWIKLATEVNRLAAQSDVDGVAITHGTDTMEETAYFLNLVVKTDKPVVLTGSMRPSTSLSADGPLNIYNAVGVASDPRAKGRGVLVVANDDIHGARAITKRHTTDVETFVSPEVGLDRRLPVRRPGVRRDRRRAAHTTATPFSVKEGQTLPRVDIIYAHAGMSPDLIDAAVANGAKGLVIAGVGDGNMTTPALEAVKRAIAKGVVVVRSTRVGEGHHPAQYRGRRRQGRHRRVEGAQSGEVSRAAQARADQDVGPEGDPGDLRQVLSGSTDRRRFVDAVTLRQDRDAQPVRDQERPGGHRHEDDGTATPALAAIERKRRRRGADARLRRGLCSR